MKMAPRARIELCIPSGSEEPASVTVTDTAAHTKNISRNYPNVK